ncbi:MAG: flagellin lysine-N-methylase [Candidatus Izemoplasmatales bacterium]
MASRNDNPRTPPVRGEFLVPDYYAAFACKGGSCRSTCCAGWTVTVPMDQYFALANVSCGPELRESIDRAFMPVLRPSPERFAEIRHDRDGRCKLLRPDGWCALHAACGEDALPSVCRYYPRGPRIDPIMESSCANSCERTLELLFEKPEPLRFERRELTFSMPFSPTATAPAEAAAYVRVRAFCLAILTDRAFPLQTRILMVGKLLSALDRDPGVDPGTVDLSVPAFASDIPGTYRTMMNVGRWFIENNRSIAAFCESVEAYYVDGEIEAKYRAATAHFTAILPDHEILFEKMLVNDLFFRQFPRGDHGTGLSDEFTALAGTYVFIRFLALNLMMTRTNRAEFVDIMAATYRVVGHTRFDKNIVVLLRDEEASSFDALGTMLQA